MCGFIAAGILSADFLAPLELGIGIKFTESGTEHPTNNPEVKSTTSKDFIVFLQLIKKELNIKYYCLLAICNFSMFFLMFS